MDFVAGDPAPESGHDVRQHGTHVAGIALGRGTAGGLEDFSFTDGANFFGIPGFDLAVQFPVNSGGTKALSGRLVWDTGGSATMEFHDASSAIILGGVTAPSPLIASLPISGVAGTDFLGLFRALDYPPAGDAALIHVTTPYDSIGDGFNLLRGVAPGCGAVALRVVNDDGIGDEADFISALDHLVLYAAAQNIVVANVSLGAIGPRGPAIETAINNVVSAGCAVVFAAGNEQGLAGIGPLGYAMKSITVGAVNRSDQLTAYSSLGSAAEADIKPDVTAPGGSNFALVSSEHDLITSVDSNDADRILNLKVFPPVESVVNDNEANNYLMLQGSSMAAPHVSGLVALIADALTHPGIPFSPWTFGTDASPLFAKMVICATAFENPIVESIFFPSLDRGAQDRLEGFGRIAADAAVEALTLEQIAGTTSESFAFGANPTAKKVWARYVRLNGISTYTMTLEVLSGSADADLYLYDDTPTPIGLPAILTASTGAGAGGESFVMDSSVTGAGVCILVGKWISGIGEFTVTVDSSGTPDLDVSPPSVDFGSQDVEAGATSPRTVTLTNNGIEPLVIQQTSILGDSSFFIQADSAESILAPSGGARAIDIAFDPDSGGLKNAALSIASNDPGNPILVVLLAGTGTGLADVWVDFTHDGTESGSVDEPFNSVREALDVVDEAGTIHIQPGTSNEVPPSLHVSKRVRLEVVGTGSATIGR